MRALTFPTDSAIANSAQSLWRDLPRLRVGCPVRWAPTLGFLQFRIWIDGCCVASYTALRPFTLTRATRGS